MDWAAVAEFAVGPHGVVLDPEVLDDDAGLGHLRSDYSSAKAGLPCWVSSLANPRRLFTR